MVVLPVREDPSRTRDPSDPPRCPEAATHAAMRAWLVLMSSVLMFHGGKELTLRPSCPSLPPSMTAAGSKLISEERSSWASVSLCCCCGCWCCCWCWSCWFWPMLIIPPGVCGVCGALGVCAVRGNVCAIIRQSVAELKS